MNNAATVKTATVFIVYITVFLFCVYMETNKPHEPVRELNESHWGTESMRMTLTNRVEVKDRKTHNTWLVYDAYSRSMDMDGSFYSTEEEVMQHFQSERIKRIKNKLYAEILKGRSSSLKIFLSVSENDSVVPQKRLRKRIPFSNSTPSRQSNAYYQLIHFITIPLSQSISGDTLPPPLHHSRSSTISCPTSFKCSYTPHSSSATCRKSTKHCVKFPITLETDLQLPITQTESCGHFNVKRRDNSFNVNEKPTNSGCPEVKRWKGSGLRKNQLRKNVRRDGRAMVGDKEEQEQEEVNEENRNKDTRISLTIDAHCSFIQEVNGLHFPRHLSLDLIFDLAGLNSLHKHEIIASLHQVLVQLLIGNGYQLVGSSTNGMDLLQYLQQEGLQQPLSVYSLWKRPDCICNCP